MKSLRNNRGDPRIIVVDYGSSAHYAKEYIQIAFSLGIEYERMETEGRPWNKCHAINRGARMSESTNICTADVYVFFVSNPLGFSIENASKKKIVHIDTYCLNEKGNIDKAIPAGRGNPGGFQFVGKKAFTESGGYDERIVYWGLEDLDWPERLLKLGYEQVWLPEPHRLYHQWHAVSEYGKLRPSIASFNTMGYCIENRMKPVLSQDWGKSVGAIDRPILKLMSSNTPDLVRVRKNALMHYGNLDILLDTKGSDKFVKVELGPRLVKRPLSRFSGAAKAILRPMTALAGLDCDDKTNRNFDYFYAMLPALVQNGLADYFISRDMSEVFLYWER